MMKVLFLTFIPSPYRLAFFEELSKECELTVLFERARSGYRDNAWNDFEFKGYEGVILQGITIKGYDKFCPSVRKYLCDKSYDIIVVSNPTSPTGIYAATILRRKNIPYIVESDGAFPTHGKGIKMWIKRFVLKPAKICMSTARLNDEYYAECGVDRTKIRRYPFSSIHNRDIIDRPLTQDEKYLLRKELNRNDDKAVITVGRFIPGKGFNTLLQVAAKLRNINFYFVGGVVTPEYQEIVHQLALKNVFFLGFMDKSCLYKHLKASDLFVLPTHSDTWGLVINEAMACGLPVVTTDMCIAGLEMIKEGVNGYITPVGECEIMAQHIQKIVSDSQLCDNMGINSWKTVRHYTIETMAAAHIQVFKEYLKRNTAQ